MNRPIGFKTILYSYHTPNGAQEAVRSLDAEGHVEGSHLSGGGGPPIVAISSESARPEDLKEIAGIIRRLPQESAAVEPARSGYLQLQVFMNDGTVRTYRAIGAQKFTDAAVQRLQQIMSSYRAGYW